MKDKTLGTRSTIKQLMSINVVKAIISDSIELIKSKTIASQSVPCSWEPELLSVIVLSEYLEFAKLRLLLNEQVILSGVCILINIQELANRSTTEM